MSWSVSAATHRDEAIQQIREQLARCTLLPAGEGARAEKIIDTIDKFAQKSVEPTDVLKVSAWGCESSIKVPDRDEYAIVSIQGGYNVSVEKAPVATGLPIRSEVGAGG